MHLRPGDLVFGVAPRLLIDGAQQIHGWDMEGRGRAFLRPSGTEPVVRVTVEADDAALVDATLARLAAVVRDATCAT